MSDDTLTLSLRGDVPLHLFAQAMEHFNALIEELSNELVGPNEIEWDVSELKGGSAVATIRGRGYDQEEVKKVVAAYDIVGKSLESGNPIPYSEKIVKSAQNITAVLNGKITAVEFITQNTSSTTSTPIKTSEELPKEKPSAFGTITGEVSAIWNRPIKLAVIDSLFGLTVHCHLDEEQREKARNVWGKDVLITGLIYRDPITDRPLDIREVKNIEVISKSPKGSYKKARGVVPRGSEPAEVIIRRYRNAI